MAIEKKTPQDKIYIDIDGEKGNAFYLLGSAKNLAKQLGMNYHTIMDEMKQGDYMHLLKTFDFPLFFTSRVLGNIIKQLFLQYFAGNAERPLASHLFFKLKLQTNLIKHKFFCKSLLNMFTRSVGFLLFFELTLQNTL